MGRSNQYRLFAARCLELAQNSSDARTKAIMVQMAQVWSRLADEINSRPEASGASNNCANDND